MNGWVGFDLDGTLAAYDYWRGAEHIGEPIAPMIELLQAHLERGSEVRIFTARVHPSHPDAETARAAVERWCEQHIGQRLAVTHEKDYGMVVLYDDRAIQVITNEGRLMYAADLAARAVDEEIKAAASYLRAAQLEFGLQAHPALLRAIDRLCTAVGGGG